MIMLMLILAVSSLLSLVVSASSNCGNGIINSGEQCELPLTKNNNYCLQSNHQCSGTLYGTRDSYGNCSSTCQCVYDLFSYSCSAGNCGAECGVDSDCNDFNSNTADTCDLSNCSCKHTPVQSCSGSNSSLLTRFSPSSCTNSSGTFSSYCSGNVAYMRGCNFVSGVCVVTPPYDCTPYNMTCSGGYCSACKPGFTWVNSANPKEGCKPVSACGNGVINFGEQCELPNTVNNNYCLQSNHQCSGRLYGSRDSYGNCNSACGCSYDSFSYSCSIGHCGAECDSMNACPMTNCDYKDGCVGNDYYDYVDVFNSCSSGCECSHTACGSPTIYYSDARCVSPPSCGNGVINFGEQCELPNTVNNNYCSQFNHQCSNKLYGSRDSYGNCNSVCGCSYDSFTYACSVGNCGAECDSTHACSLTQCDYLDGCVGTTYYDYSDVFNSCSSGCECSHNSCTSYTAYPNDARCVSYECYTDSDCNRLDSTYCSGDSVFHVEGVCVNHACVSGSASLVQDCNSFDRNFCEGSVVKNDNGYCFFGACYVSTTTVNNCNDGLFCNGVESCSLGYCISGTAVDCSAYNIAGVANCNNNPDCNPLTWDYRASFTSSCSEATDSCTAGSSFISSACSVSSCSAECDSSHSCPATQCNYLDGCRGNDYYDYSNVLNSCTSSCTCTANSCSNPTIYHNDARCVPQPTCGNGVINFGEQCEFPNTVNNNYCPQFNHQCSNKLYGSRDSYGNCNSACGCSYDSFSYSCSVGNCGAECDSTHVCSVTDCDYKDGCVGNNYYDYSDVANSCSASCDCSHNSCSSTPFQIIYNDARCVPQPTCGNGVINFGEQCEFPNTVNNNYCLQSNHQCLGKLYGSRDSYGNCNSACGCSYDSFSYSCIVGNCGAECDSGHPCAATECDYLDSCVGRDYYDYSDVANSCIGGCTCTNSACGAPVVIRNDSRCGECSVNSDCSNLDYDFCSESSVFHSSGVCILNRCASGTPVLVRNCNDGLFCNGVESCSAGSCVAGTPVDCSAFNIAGVSTCNNVPDGNPLTWDYRSSFISSCSEATDSCTQGSLAVTSTCDKSGCNASCTIGETDNRSCGLGGYQIRACTASCSWSEWSNCTDEGECAAGTVENKTCGNCGTSQRICKSNYQWGNWSACSNEGVCAAGSIAAERCGFMLTGTKTRSCSDSCSWQPWGNCTGEGECYPGTREERDCTTDGYSGKDERTCMSNFRWGAWTGCTLPETQINIDSLRIINDDCVQPGGELMASVQVGYYSYKDGSITITAVIPDLGLRSRIGPIDVNSRDDISQLLIMRIPDETPEGTYDVRFTINDDYRRVKYREITVSRSCGKCPDYCRV